MPRTRVGETRSFMCIACGARVEKFCKAVEGAIEEVDCHICGGECAIVEKTSPLAHRPFTPYYHHQLDQYFHSRSDEKSYTKKHGMVNISGDFGKGSMAERKSPKEFCRDRYLAKRGVK